MNLDQMKIKFDGEFRIRIFWKLSIKFCSLNVKSQASNFSRVKISWKLNFLLFEGVLSKFKCELNKNEKPGKLENNEIIRRFSKRNVWCS